MSKHSDIKALEAKIPEMEQIVQQRDKALRLSANQDFRDLFINGLFKDETARLTHLSTDPNLSQQDRDDALRMAQSSGYTKRFLSAMIQMGQHAEDELPGMRQTLDELRAMPDEEPEGDE